MILALVLFLPDISPSPCLQARSSAAPVFSGTSQEAVSQVTPGVMERGRQGEAGMCGNCDLVELGQSVARPSGTGSTTGASGPGGRGGQWLGRTPGMGTLLALGKPGWERGLCDRLTRLEQRLPRVAGEVERGRKPGPRPDLINPDQATVLLRTPEACFCPVRGSSGTRIC